jgi:hypothetical protein
MKWLGKQIWTGETMKYNLHGDEKQLNRVTNTDDNKERRRPGEKRYNYVIQELGNTKLKQLIIN